MTRRTFSLPALALAGTVAFAGQAHAADTLYWSEAFNSFTTGTNSRIATATGLPGTAASSLVSGNANVRGPNGVEFIDGRIWWPDQQLNVIASVLPDGSGYRAFGAGNPYDLDIEGNTLYWTQNSSGRISVIDLSAEFPVSTLLVTGLNRPFAIDVSGGAIYWSEVVTSNRLMRSGLDGSNPEQLIANVQSYDFEVLGDHIYLTTTDGFVKRANLDGTGLTTLASNLGFLNGIDVTDDAIYVSRLDGVFDGPGFSTLGAGRILRMDLDGGNVAEIYVAPQEYDGIQPFTPSAVRGVAVLVAVPEPATWAMMAVGLGGLLLGARRNARRR